MTVNTKCLKNISINWDFVESIIYKSYEGLLRKSGEPMSQHSINVGRTLRKRKYDSLTVFGGYCHDLWEDTSMNLDDIESFAFNVFNDVEIASIAKQLVKEVSYQPDEYKLEKKKRKEVASARWIITPNQRVAPIKIADIEDNMKDVSKVNKNFENNYREWSEPLYEALKVKIQE